MVKKSVILIIFFDFFYSLFSSLYFFNTSNVELLMQCFFISLLCLVLQMYFIKKDSKFYNVFVNCINSSVKYSIYIGLSIILMVSLIIDDSHFSVIESKFLFFAFCLDYLLLIDLIVLIVAFNKHKNCLK